MSDKRFKKGMNLSCFDTETGKFYWYACNLCGLLNNQQAIISALKEENEVLLEEWSERQQYFKKVEDEYHERVIEQQTTIKRLQEKVTDYEIILSITDDKRTLCKEQQIDDVAFYCERYSDYRCYPLCPNTKDCFKADGTFQDKLKDLKEFWGEKWK